MAFLTSPKGQLATLLGIALVLRLAWMIFTNFTYEDAYITFRYAQRLSTGQGFVYNVGERVDGTSTPLFTLLMAGWLLVDPGDPVMGARLIGLAAGLISLGLVWSLLGRLNITDLRRLIPIALLVMSDKLWARDTGGMETSLAICLMLAAWYAAVRGWSARAGLLAGLMLWTRIDMAVWLAVLSVVCWYADRRPPIRLVVFAGLIYLPWVVFATLYFGSPVPFTVIAKWQAYNIAGAQSPYLEHLLIILRWLTPFSLPENAATGLVDLLWIFTAFCAAVGAIAIRRIRPLLLLAAFGLTELAVLTLARATFSTRYFMPLLWVMMILAGIGLGSIWNRLSTVPHAARGAATLTAALAVIGIDLGLGYGQALAFRDIQQNINDRALKSIGLWLEQNTVADAAVLLEPLGYIGYYANRRMIDVVGLVSPEIVDLKRQGLTTLQAVPIIRPDYIVIHCDDALDWEKQSESGQSDFVAHYQRAVTFNPMNFDPVGSDETALQRTACYEVWGPRK